MLDIKFMRENRDAVLAAMRVLGAEDAPVAQALALDERRRAILARVEVLRAERNSGSKQIGQLMREGKRAEGQALQAHMTAVGDEIKALDEELAQVEADLQDAMLRIPNLPHPSVPVGKDDTENVVVREEGQPRAFDFEPQPHWDLGTALDIIDFERGVKLSGTRFYVLKGAGARLQRALITWMLDLHTQKHGYTEIYPPYMVKSEMLVGTGNLPKFGDNLYHDAEEDFWWIPTAEVPVTNLYRDEILDGAQLPIYHVAYTACFRREKMSRAATCAASSAGTSSTRSRWSSSSGRRPRWTSSMKLVDDAEDVCRGLGIPYRVIQMCTGDLCFTAAVKYDLELWAPGCGEWLEVSSCSNFVDFQARRANIRFRPEPGAKPEFVHTLNGSGLALPRVLIAVIENYQQADGSIVVPEVLRPYMGGMERIG